MRSWRILWSRKGKLDVADVCPDVLMMKYSFPRIPEAEIQEQVNAYREKLVNRVIEDNPMNSKTGRIA